MNEVRKIHISRQAYTIAVDAYGELKKYLDALQAKIGDDDVYKEIELRIVELLAEHGVTPDKVILKDDVAFLKENLGELSDFEEGEKTAPEERDLPRRFMRNPRGQMLGGVANGLASYFGIDPIWARIGFIALTFASGFGILMYIILWAIMPEAKTSSDFIQMQGRPVTVDSITEFAESRQVEEGIHRIGKFTVDMLRLMLRIVLYCVAIGLTTVGVLGILGSIAGAVFVIAGSDRLFGGVQIFPVTGMEVAAVIAGAIAGITASVFMLFSGMGIFAKKWQLPTWATASLVTLFFVSLFTAIPLTGASAPKVSQRIDDAYKTHTRQVAAFQKLQVTSNDEVSVRFEVATEYSVGVKLFGEKEAALMETKVEGEVLSLDARAFNDMYRCYDFCVYQTRLEITVRGPSINSLVVDGPVYFESLDRLPTQQLEVVQRGGARVDLAKMYPEKLTYSKDQNRLLLEGLREDALESDRVSLPSYDGHLLVKRATQVYLVDQEAEGCDSWERVVILGSLPSGAYVNGTDVLANLVPSPHEDPFEDTDSQRTLSNCMIVDGSIY